MTKKLLALGLSLTMALSLAACGGNSGSSASGSSSNTDASTSQADASGSTGDSSTAAEVSTVEDGKLILGTSADYPPLRVPHPGRERRGPDRGSGCGPGPPDRRGHGPGV